MGSVLLGRRSLRSLVLCCRFWRLARRASRALLVRAPGSPPGRKRGSGAPTAFCGSAGGCAVLGRAPPPRSEPRPPGCPPPARGLCRAAPVRAGPAPCRAGALGVPIRRALRLLVGRSRGSPRASGGVVCPPPHAANFFCAPIRKLVKMLHQKF